MPIAVSSTLSPKQYSQSVDYRARQAAPRWTRAFCFVLTVLAAIPLGYLAAAGATQRYVSGTGVLIAAIAVWALLTAVQIFSKAVSSSAIQRSTFMTREPWNLEMQEEGMLIRNAHVHALHRWSGIDRIEEHGGIVYLMFDSMHFHPVPAATFADNAAKDAFVAEARAQIAKAKGSSH